MATSAASARAALKNIVSPAKDMVKSITSKLKASKLKKGSMIQTMRAPKMPASLMKSFKSKAK